MNNKKKKKNKKERAKKEKKRLNYLFGEHWVFDACKIEEMWDANSCFHEIATTFEYQKHNVTPPKRGLNYGTSRLYVLCQGW